MNFSKSNEIDQRDKGKIDNENEVFYIGNNSKKPKSLIVSSWEDLDNVIQNSYRTGT